MTSRELPSHQHTYLDQLTAWVGTQFGQYTSYSQFEDAFNAHFTKYQKEKRKKLDIDSLQLGYISCSGAALIAALWALRFDDQPEPYFLINREDESKAFHALHVLLALPIIRSFERDTFAEELNTYRTGKMKNISLIDYFYKSEKGTNQLRVTPPADTPYNFMFLIGLERFFSNRCRTFNFLQD